MPIEEVFNYDDLKKWIEYNDNFYNVTLVFYHSDLCKSKENFKNFKIHKKLIKVL